MFKIKNFLSSYKRLIFSIVIFLIVFCVLGVPFTNWGFLGDDFGAIYHSKISSFKDLLSFFYEGSACNIYQPSNFKAPCQNFFNIYYRPLIFVFYYLQYLVFGTNAYFYFLLNIFFHAIISVILFNIFLYFVDFLWAFWGALFFAFHPILFSWLGWIASQQYHFELLFLILICFFLYKYLLSNINYYFVVSLFLYFLSLLNRETLIVLPLIIFCGLLAYKDELKTKIMDLFKIFSCFSIVSLFYLIGRIYFFGLGAKNNNVDFFSKIYFFANRSFTNILCLIYSSSGMGAVFRKNIFLRYSLIVFLICILGISFLSFSQKLKYKIIFVFAAFFCLSWPLSIILYDNRYVYLGLPFFVLGSLISFNYGEIFSKKYFKNILLILLYLLLINNMVFLSKNLKNREKDLFLINNSFKSLAKDEIIINKIVCFVGLPWDFFYSGSAQAIWLNGINLNLPVYYDDSTWGYFNKTVEISDCEIFKDKNQIRFISKNENLFFGESLSNLSIGKKIINKKDKLNRVYDFILLIDQQYIDFDPVFVTWDYKNLKFKILD